MKTGALLIPWMLLLALAVSALTPPGLAPLAFDPTASAQLEGPTFADVIPADVFFYVAQKPNPERQFYADYWDEVGTALLQSGLPGDVLALLGSLMGPDHSAELKRLKERATQLIGAIDWDQLGNCESVFVERFDAPLIHGEGLILLADLVWMVRGDAEGVAKNYEGLVALLGGFADEINRASGMESLVVERSTRLEAEIASIDLLGKVPGAPPLLISVVRRNDTLMIAMRERLLGDILTRMEGEGVGESLGSSPRFRAAFAQLPAAEDSMTFFDMQSLLTPVSDFLEVVIRLATEPGDTYRNTGRNETASQLTKAGNQAYRKGEIERALSLTREAHQADPLDSIALYNLACFNSLLGHQEEALAWLTRAVEAGFYAPRKIASDPDLVALRETPEYQVALARAKELAAEIAAQDIVLNSSTTGEAYGLTLQVWGACAQQDHDQAMKLAEQAHAVAPEDSRVLYALACVHALQGHDARAAMFLEKAVEGGFYCPRHIAGDPDLENIRGQARYRQAEELARKKAAAEAGRTGGTGAVVKSVMDRLTGALGVLDYVAGIETTDGFSTSGRSVAVLVPGAEKNPIYPLLSRRIEPGEFARFLPQETLSFSVSAGVDPSEIYRYVEETVRGVGPMGEQVLARWEQLQQGLEVDFQRDVVGWIDGANTSVKLEGGRGSVWLLLVTDEAVAREQVAAVEEFLTTTLPALIAKAAAENPALARLAMLTVRTGPLEHEHLQGFRNLYLPMMPQPVVFGVSDGALVFGSSADAAAVCLRTARGEHPRITDNPRVMNEAIVPSDSFANASLVDLRSLNRELSAGVGIASMLIGMLSAAVPEPELQPVLAGLGRMLAKLPQVLGKIDFYKSTASETAFDGRTWRIYTVTHFASPEERAAARSK